MVARMVANNVVLAIFLTMYISSFQLKSRMMAWAARPRYFAGDWSPVGCDEQNPVVDCRGKAQMQPVEQG